MSLMHAATVLESTTFTTWSGGYRSISSSAFRVVNVFIIINMLFNLCSNSSNYGRPGSHVALV